MRMDSSWPRLVPLSGEDGSRKSSNGYLIRGKFCRLREMDER